PSCFNRERRRGKSVYQTQTAREAAQGRRNMVGVDDGHGTRRSYSRAGGGKNRGALSSAGRGIVAVVQFLPSRTRVEGSRCGPLRVISPDPSAVARDHVGRRTFF